MKNQMENHAYAMHCFTYQKMTCKITNTPAITPAQKMDVGTAPGGLRRQFRATVHQSGQLRFGLGA